jgi:hypothetical protein
MTETNCYQSTANLRWYARKPGQEWRDFGQGEWAERCARYWAEPPARVPGQ